MSEIVFHKSQLVVISLLLLCGIGVILPVSAYENEIDTIATQMAQNIVNSGKSRVAVVDFTLLQGDITELGRFISEEFSVALLSTGGSFEVVDRTHLQTVLKEHKLSATGRIDPQTAE